MEIGKTFKPKTKNQLRSWFERNHEIAKEIWIVFYKKESGKKFLHYIDVLDEALCFGWIDSIVKKIDSESRAQRFTPRKPNSPMSTMNKEKIRRLIKEGRMTKFGLAFAGDLTNKSVSIPSKILKELKKDKETWANFQRFPRHYKRIRINWIKDAINRNDVYNQRLNYFLKMTRQNKKYGMEQ